MNYFSNCYTIHDAKKQFRELTKIHHPDAGGDSKNMAEIIWQYDQFIPDRQPHDNFFKSILSHERTYNSPPRSFASFQGNIPFDHPIMIELRDLRSKFNYSMNEENQTLKKQNQNLYEKLKQEKLAHEKNKDKYKKIISKLQQTEVKSQSKHNKKIKK